MDLTLAPARPVTSTVRHAKQRVPGIATVEIFDQCLAKKKRLGPA